MNDHPLDAAELADAVSVANIPTLLPVLVQLTGDESWLEEPYRPSRTRGMEDNDSGDLPVDIQSHVRAAALDALLEWSNGRKPAIELPEPDLMVRMLSASMGEQVPAEYGAMLQQELREGLGFAEREPIRNGPPHFTVAIIGAGLTGIAAAARMAELGVPYVVFERSDSVGGVWRDNRYPGASVDTPSHLYSYSFAPYDWEHFFADRAEIESYLTHVADEFELTPNIRFGVEVERALYDTSSQLWRLTTRTTSGETEILDFHVVVTAVGAFTQPKMPSIPGLSSFEGLCFHTSEWPADATVAGQRVAVIGNGASAMQVVPAIAAEVDDLVIFQRQPQWVQPFDKLRKEVPGALRTLMKAVPLYRMWYRLRLTWIFHDKLHAALQRDPEWHDQTHSINAANDRHRQYLSDYIRSEVGECRELLAHVLPDYPPFGKRMLMDNGWYRALRRDNVHLVSDAIVEIEPHAIRTAAGERYEVDAIIAASGFDVVRFLSTIDVVGLEGRTLREEWNDDDCAAYLGLTVPGFPNFFSLYGPNTQPGHGGSLVGTIEDQLDYLSNVLRQMINEGIGAVDCRREIYDHYVRRVDDAHSRMVWTHPGMSTYYRNSRGRVVVNSPFRNLDFWTMTRGEDLRDVFTCEPDKALPVYEAS